MVSQSRLQLQNEDKWWEQEIPRMREHNRLEAKRAKGGLSHSIWETYSSFANTDGGMILLGVSENPDHSLSITGVDDAHKMVQDFWNTVHDTSKISSVVLSNDDVNIRHTSHGNVICINVPRASRERVPVYVGPNPMKGSYRRNGDGDYLCDEEDVRAMLRDSELKPLDRQIVGGMTGDVLNGDSIRAYRQRFRGLRPGHPWAEIPDEDFLLRVGALSLDGSLARPTRAGLLMFGHAWNIIEEFPYYFLDYREMFNGADRWSDRITSDDGDWSGNIYDFWEKVVNRLRYAVAHPFQLGADMHRIDDNPMDKAVREAVTNTLVHADYYVRRGTVIVQYADRIVFSNPGRLRLSVDEVVYGGISDARNPTLMKMFNLIGVGEKAGSGFDVMRAGCEFAGTAVPELRVTDNPGRVQLTLYPRAFPHYADYDVMPSNGTSAGSSVGGIRVVTDDSSLDCDVERENALHENAGSAGNDSDVETMGKSAIKSKSYVEKITRTLIDEGPCQTSYLAQVLGLGLTRTREILADLVKAGTIQPVGVGRGRKYQLVADN